MSLLEWPDFKRTYFPLRNSKIQSVFTKIMVSSQNNMVKQINFDTLSKFNMWNKLLFKEIETQQKLAQQYPENVLQILHYGVQKEIKNFNIYIVYDCDQDAQPFLDYINSITFIGDEQKLRYTSQLLQISCLLQASGIQHRNIKPNNLVYFKEKVLLTDFGSARTHYLSYGKDYTALAEKKWQREFWYYQCPEFIKILQEENLDFREQAWEEVNYNEDQRCQLYQRADLWSIGLIMITLFSSSFKYPSELNQFYGFNSKKLEGKLIELSDTTHMAIIESIKAILKGEMKAIEIYQLFNNLKKFNDKKIVSLSTINKEEDKTINKFQCSKKIDMAYDKNYYFINKQNITELDKIQDLQRKSTFTRDKPSVNEIRIIDEEDECNQLIHLSDDNNNTFQISNFNIDNEEFQVTSPKMLKLFTDQKSQKQLNSVSTIPTKYNVTTPQNINELIIVSQGNQQQIKNSTYSNVITEQLQQNNQQINLQSINDSKEINNQIRQSQVIQLNQQQLQKQSSKLIPIDDLQKPQEQTQQFQDVSQFSQQQSNQQFNSQFIEDSQNVNNTARQSQVIQFNQQQQMQASKLISIDDLQKPQQQAQKFNEFNQFSQQQKDQQLNFQLIDDFQNVNNTARQSQVTQFNQQQLQKQSSKLIPIDDLQKSQEQAQQFKEFSQFNQQQSNQQNQLIQIDDSKTYKKTINSQAATQFNQQGNLNQQFNMISIDEFQNAQQKARQPEKFIQFNQQEITNQQNNLNAIDDFNQNQNSTPKKNEFKIFNKDQFNQLTYIQQNEIREELIRYRAQTTNQQLQELITQQLDLYEEFKDEEGFSIFNNTEILLQSNVTEEIALKPISSQFQQQQKQQQNVLNIFTQKSENQPLDVVQFDEIEKMDQSSIKSGLLIVQQQVAENIVIRPEPDAQAQKFINNQTISNLVQPYELIDVNKQSLQKYSQELNKLIQTASNQDKQKIIQQLERINQIEQTRTEIIKDPLKKQELSNLNNKDLVNYKTILMQIRTNDVSIKDQINDEIKNITNRIIAKDKIETVQQINNQELKQLSLVEAECLMDKFNKKNKINQLTPQQQQNLLEIQEYINVQRKFEIIKKNQHQTEILTQNELQQFKDEQLNNYLQLLRDQFQQKSSLPIQQQMTNIVDRQNAMDQLKQFKQSQDLENLLSNQSVGLLSPAEQQFYETQLQFFLTDPTLDKSIQDKIRKQLQIIQDNKLKQQSYQQQQQQQLFQDLSQNSNSQIIENNEGANQYNNLAKQRVTNIALNPLNPLGKLDNLQLPKIGKDADEQLKSKLNLFLLNPQEKFILSNEEIDKLTKQQQQEYFEQLKNLIENSHKPSQKLRSQLQYIKSKLAHLNLNPIQEKLKSIEVNTLPSDHFSPKDPTQDKCYSIEENQRLKEMEKDFKIWSTNPIVRRFQVWKITNEQLINFPQKYANLIKPTPLREKKEDKHKIYGGYWLDGKPSGLGILMKKDHGGIYEGVFEDGKFVYGMVLELNSSGKLQKYIGEYHLEYQLKNGICKIEWYDELRSQNFELKEWHEGTIVLNKFRGKGTRFYKDGRKYVGQWKNNMKDGQGEVFKRGNNNQYTKIFEGEFKAGVYHGNGTIIFDQNLKQIGAFRNGNPVGRHELFRGQILEKKIDY